MPFSIAFLPIARPTAFAASLFDFDSNEANSLSKVEAETKKVQAQADADTAIIKAEGEAKANKIKSDSITDNLIRMKEAEAREKHGWVTVNGAQGVITKQE